MSVVEQNTLAVLQAQDKILPLSQVAQNEILTRDVQERLIELKLLDPPVDGKFGPLTTASLQRFQILAGIKGESEALGPKTVAALLTYTPDNLPSPAIALRTRRETIFKTRPLQSSTLSPHEQFKVDGGQGFALANYEGGHRRHYRITLQEAIQNQYIWYAFEEHIELLSDNQPMSRPQQLASSVRLNVPYKSQMDNWYNPSGSCNVTSLAMCLEYLGVPRYDNRFRQLEDELYQWCLDKGYSRHHPEDLAQVVRDYHRTDDFTYWGTIERCQDHLRGGNPCVIHGYFTSFGHIIVLVGFDEKGFIVHDPYGEWFSSGYWRNQPGNQNRGKYLHYSYNLIRRTCLPDGQFWVHYISR
jgi:uncharacterized protein YvpB